MRIRHVRIHNYRSIRDIELQCQSLVVLLGPNNHGKSNILGAIEFALSSSNKVSAEDFFAFRSSEEADLWVELEFDQLTDQERTTFQKYVSPAGTVKIRKEARLANSNTVETGYRGYASEPAEWWLKGSGIQRLLKREDVENESATVPPLKKLLETKGKITRAQVEEFQAEYRTQHAAELTLTETLEDAPLLGLKNVASGVLPDFYLLPAIRDLSDETKTAKTTMFGRLLQRAVQEMASRDPQFVELRNSLESLVNSLNASPAAGANRPTQLQQMEESIDRELNAWGVKVSIEVTPPELEKLFELGTQLHIDDGLRTTADRKGHGLQRAVIFALLRAWAKALRAAPEEATGTTSRKASESVIFAIEEPELFLHPHAQRRLASAIAEIAEAPGHQAFLCTHSTHFVDVDRYPCIAIASKEKAEDGTRVRQCMKELFEGSDASDQKSRFHLASWINPDRGELFFAKKVLLVEGETEATLLPYLANKLGCLDSDLSVIDCGGKHNLPLYIALLNAFQISYAVVHDEDPLPDPIPAEWEANKIAGKRRTFALNAVIQGLVDTSLGHIEMLAPDFENVAGVSKSQGDRKGKALAALDHFAVVPGPDVPTRLNEVVRSVYQQRTA